MTRKRFTKLLMSQGYSRNEAQDMAFTQRQKGRSYAEAFAALTPTMWGINAQGFAEAVQALFAFAQATIEAVTEGIAAFGDALDRAMDKLKS